MTVSIEYYSKTFERASACTKTPALQAVYVRSFSYYSCLFVRHLNGHSTFMSTFDGKIGSPLKINFTVRSNNNFS